MEGQYLWLKSWFKSWLKHCEQHKRLLRKWLICCHFEWSNNRVSEHSRYSECLHVVYLATRDRQPGQNWENSAYSTYSNSICLCVWVCTQHGHHSIVTKVQAPLYMGGLSLKCCNYHFGSHWPILSEVRIFFFFFFSVSKFSPIAVWENKFISTELSVLIFPLAGTWWSWFKRPHWASQRILFQISDIGI